MFDYYQVMRRKTSISIYLGGGPFSTCPFSTIVFSGKSPLSVLATLTGPLPYELLDDELEPVLGLGTGKAGGAFPRVSAVSGVSTTLHCAVLMSSAC